MPSAVTQGMDYHDDGDGRAPSSGGTKGSSPEMPTRLLSGPDSHEYLQTPKIIQQWHAQGGDIHALIGITPEALAIENSIRTAIAEEENRQFIRQFGFDLQNMSDELLRSFKDGYYMIEVKRAWAKGLFDASKQEDFNKTDVARPPSQHVKDDQLSVQLKNPNQAGQNHLESFEAPSKQDDARPPSEHYLNYHSAGAPLSVPCCS